MTKVTAYRAALSGIGHVFVSDALPVCHTQNSSVVGIRPRGARIAADEGEAPQAPTPSGKPSGAGLRVAGLSLARELRAWAALIEPSSRRGPVLAVIGGGATPADFESKCRVLEYMLSSAADTVALGTKHSAQQLHTDKPLPPLT